MLADASSSAGRLCFFSLRFIDGSEVVTMGFISIPLADFLASLAAFLAAFSARLCSLDDDNDGVDVDNDPVKDSI